MAKQWILAAVVVAAGATGAAAQQTSCEATAAQFGQLREGMTYQQIAGIIGCDGELLSSSEVGNYKTEMYAWAGSGGFGANMNVMLQNDRMMMKSQFGLK